MKDGGQFIPHPSTWLNRNGWEDEIQISTTTADSDDGGQAWKAFIASHASENARNFPERKFAPQFLRDEFQAWRRR